MIDPYEILKKYWGYDAFRPKQLQIIQSIIHGKDTLALLPTGGGKSICYQVPALQQEGICLVISPLIALMEDQVNQLKARQIPCLHIHSGMSSRQIDIALDNAVYGAYKFLYVSPERLQTRLFRARFEKMKVSLIAIDEAHCISEWGYDFRPAYLSIAELRELKPSVPFLALTATATPDVVTDIQEKLGFRAENSIRNSFRRSNLTYNRIASNNKRLDLETFLQRKKDVSGIIYCNTRRRVKECFIQLQKKGFSVGYYHGGLEHDERKKRQIDWTDGTVKIMVSTNAFGMGIDKGNVRFVLHYDLPDSIEAYFQEAGRAGRDGAPAEAFLFFENTDLKELERKNEQKYPELAVIKKIYYQLGNHFQLAYGAGKDERFPIDLAEFSAKYDLPLVTVYNSLNFLERCGFLQLSENFKQRAQILFLVDRKALYNQQVRDAEINTVLQFIMRTEIGVFDQHVPLNIAKMSQKTGLSNQSIHKKLDYLHQLELVDYLPKAHLPSVTFRTERLTNENLSIPSEFYHQRKKISHQKMRAMIDYVTNDSCSNVFLLEYFGETDAKRCGICNNCQKSQKKYPKEISKAFRSISQKHADTNGKITLEAVRSELFTFPQDVINAHIRHLMDHNEIVMDELARSFHWNGK